MIGKSIPSMKQTSVALRIASSVLIRRQIFLDNVLCQVIGEKEVILFNPSLTSYLYPALHTVQKNTSQVDISRPDLTKHPLYKEVLSLVNSNKGGVDLSDASYLSVGRTILYPGDAVFIPFKWWHYCKASKLSCSITFCGYEMKSITYHLS